MAAGLHARACGSRRRRVRFTRERYARTQQARPPPAEARARKREAGVPPAEEGGQTWKGRTLPAEAHAQKREERIPPAEESAQDVEWTLALRGDPSAEAGGAPASRGDVRP
jgi:hypothetical protein